MICVVSKQSIYRNTLHPSIYNPLRHLQLALFYKRNREGGRGVEGVGNTRLKCWGPGKGFRVHMDCTLKQSLISDLKEIPGLQSKTWILHCCGSGMIYSGSSFEFSEFRIQAKVPDPCGSEYGSNPNYLSVLERRIYQLQYMPCSILYYSPIVLYKQSRIHRPKMRNNFFLYLLFHFLLDTNPGIRIHADPDPD